MSNSDEHQRRSPDCVFFTLSTAVQSNVGRSKKGRASKSSRMSTQSNHTTVSDGLSVAEPDISRDDSVVSVAEPVKVAKSAKGAKKGAKAKKPLPKSKRQANRKPDDDLQVASSYLEPEDDDFEVKVESASPKSKGSKKRKSDEMSNDASNHTDAHKQEDVPLGQPKKRRATRTRGSIAQTRNEPSPPPMQEAEVDAEMKDAKKVLPTVPSQNQRKGKGGKKRSSSKVRKASTTSNATMASLRAPIPADDEIDAALEADLDRPLTDEESEIEPPAMTKTKSRRLTRTKPGSRKVTASVAPTRRTTRASTVTVGEPTVEDIYPSLPGHAHEAHMPTPEKNEHVTLVHDSPKPSLSSRRSKRTSAGKDPEQQKAQEKKAEKLEEAISAAAAEDTKVMEIHMTEAQKPRSRLASKQLSVRSSGASAVSRSLEAMDLTSDIQTSGLDKQTGRDDSGHETDASVLKQARTKRGGKKPLAKVKGGKKGTLKTRNIEDTVQPTVDTALPEDQDTQEGPVDDRAGDVKRVLEDAEETETQENASGVVAQLGKPIETPAEAKTFAREGSAAPSMDQPEILPEAEIVRPLPQSLSAVSTPRPAPSPQSSDAENQPPSSRTPKLCPPFSIQSPSKSQISRVPLAAATPVNSPSRNNVSKLQSTFPWTAIEIEHIFESTPVADKENNPFDFGMVVKGGKSLLTSPERKLTVEQWIQTNAQTGEERLRNECERLVGKFEEQGVRALRVLEGIVCSERL